LSLFYLPAFRVIDFKGPLETAELLLVLFLFTAYFLPCGIAGMRKVKGGCLIFFVNLLLGWTVIGWFVALAMAFGARRRVSGDTDLTQRRG